MGVKSLLAVFVLLFLVSCSYEETVINQAKPLVFIVDDTSAEPKFETFVVEDEDPLSWFYETKERRYQLNMRRIMADYEDEQEEIAFKQKFANVRRIIVNEFGQSEFVIGYDQQLDNPDFKKFGSDKMGRMYSEHYTFKVE